MKIFVAHDGQGCAYVRLIQPLRQLAKRGHDITFTLYTEPEAVEALRPGTDWDIFVAQRFAGYEGMGRWRRARTPRNRFVYETDDDMYHIDKINWSAYNKFGVAEVQEGLKAYTQMADLVTVTTETLAQVQRDELGVKNIAVLPNCIPEYVLELERSQNRRPRIGWCGGASHGLDITEASAQVRRFLARNQEWDLYLAGTDYRPTFNVRNWDQMIYADWKQINDCEREFYKAIDFEIGIAPLRDTVFGRSKSAIKALEYNARGIPVIASDVKPYQEYVVHGENGFLVKHPHEWDKYLGLLAKNPDLRQEMGEKAKVHASAWTHEGNWQRWEKAYEELFK